MTRVFRVPLLSAARLKSEIWLLLWLLFWPHGVWAAPTPVQVVVPKALATNDSAFGAGTLSGSFHMQEVYGADNFPAGTLRITELRFRPDYRYGKAFSTTIANLEIRLSTTERAPDTLSRVFANNPGGDETLVYQGALSLASAFTGPANGPKAFDMVIPLSTPFSYSPDNGNLLLDVRTFGTSQASRLSGRLSSSDTASRVYGAVGAVSGGADSGADALQVVGTLTLSTNPPPPGFGRPIRGPYLQMAGPSNIVVRWRTTRATDTVVCYGTNLDHLDLSVSNATLTTEHELQLTFLQPETKYYYAVGGNGVLTSNQADTYFITAPPIGSNRPTRVWFISDYGYPEHGEYAVRDSYLTNIAALKPAEVWLTGGDNDQHDGSDANDQFSIFEAYASLLRHTPIWPALGNHDGYTASDPGPYPYFDNFSLPTQGEAGGLPSGSEHYFSFDYGDVHFVLLDSIAPELSASLDSPMLGWLRADLAQTAQRWIIAYWHGPPYTKGSHDSDGAWDLSARMIQMRENVLPILEANGVDLVLGGHSHVYERSYLLHGHYDYSWNFSPTNLINAGDGRPDGDGAYRQREGQGTVYVVAATGGGPGPFAYGAHPAHRVRIPSQLGSCVLDITSNRLDYQFVSETGVALDRFTLLKDAPRPPWHLTGVRRSPEDITLEWTAVPGQCYRVEWRPTFAEPWSTLADGIRAVSTGASWTGPAGPAAATGFYRVALSSCAQ